MKFDTELAQTGNITRGHKTERHHCALHRLNDQRRDAATMRLYFSALSKMPDDVDSLTFVSIAHLRPGYSGMRSDAPESHRLCIQYGAMIACSAAGNTLSRSLPDARFRGVTRSNFSRLVSNLAAQTPVGLGAAGFWFQIVKRVEGRSPRALGGAQFSTARSMNERPLGRRGACYIF